MKTLLNIFLACGFFILLVEKASGGRPIGGEITYKHISGFTYRIDITLYMTYSIISGDVDHPLLDSVHLGDGSIITFYRDSFADLPNDIRVSYYSEEHTFLPGQYELYVVHPNRKGNIANIPNSFYTLFSVKSELNVSESCPNNSVTFADLPIFYARHDRTYIHNIAVLNSDHDSLSFELVTCLAENGQPLPGYSFPPGFSIDPVSGEISSGGLPDSICIYDLAVKITEWRNGTVVGYVMRDYTVDTKSSNGNPSFFNPLPVQQDTSGNYFISVNPADTIALNIHYTDNSNIPSLAAYSEAMSVGNPASVSISSGGTDTATATLTWIPDASHARAHPYIFTFRETHDLFQSDLTLLCYVNGIAPDSCYSNPHIGIEEIPMVNHLATYPNPATKQFVVCSPPKDGFAGANLHSTIKSIEIFDALGKSVLLSAVHCESCIVNCESFSPGIYFVKAFAGEKVLIGKIIKE